MKIIALEEHYVDEEVLRHLGQPLNNLSERMVLGHHSRIAEMDAAGIDIQVISHAPAGLQRVAGTDAVSLSRAANDRLGDFVGGSPRFRAFASLPTIDPQSAARELERCAAKPSFVGGVINGTTEGKYTDDPAFWPIYEAAEALDVPIYLHPALLPESVSGTLIGAYGAAYPMYPAAAWGFAVDAGTHAMRLALSGVFKQFPNLRIILGHLGEGIPFLLDRIDESLARNNSFADFAEMFRRHFVVTTSGFFSKSALECTISQLGIERVMFSVDWPFAQNDVASSWIRSASLSKVERQKICWDNAMRVLGIAEPKAERALDPQ